jgi:hypothetical protein
VEYRKKSESPYCTENTAGRVSTITSLILTLNVFLQDELEFSRRLIEPCIGKWGDPWDKKTETNHLRVCVMRLGKSYLVSGASEIHETMLLKEIPRIIRFWPTSTFVRYPNLQWNGRDADYNYWVSIALLWQNCTKANTICLHGTTTESHYRLIKDQQSWLRPRICPERTFLITVW